MAHAYKIDKHNNNNDNGHCCCEGYTMGVGVENDNDKDEAMCTTWVRCKVKNKFKKS